MPRQINEWIATVWAGEKPLTVIIASLDPRRFLEESMRLRAYDRRFWHNAKLAAVCVFSFLSVVFCGSIASAQTNSDYTFQKLFPDFLKTGIPNYAQDERTTSPAKFEPDHGDFFSQFVSPTGKTVTVVVKAPVTEEEYDVPPIAPGQTVNDYLNGALYDSQGQPRSKTIIKLPRSTYIFDFPLFSNCTSTTDHQPKFVHWQLPMGASDLVIDGQGSVVNFSDLCLGLNLPNVERVTIKNFTFSWPNIEIAAVGTITATGGNGNTGFTYSVKIPPLVGNLPKMIAATTSWDRAADHWDLETPNDDISYGDGVTNGVPVTCVESSAQQKTEGCTVEDVPSFGVSLKVGESVLLRFYSFATAISASGDDVTLDHITLKNLIGSDYSYNTGRGLHVTHLLLTRMEGQPISAGGGGSLLTNVGGDVVIDNSRIGYQADDAFDMNTTIMRYTPTQVVNNTPMNTFVFDSSAPKQLQWPGFNFVQVGDPIGLFDNTLAFKGVATVTAVSAQNANGAVTLTLSRAINPALGKAGFIAGDLKNSAGARYIIRDNYFEFNRARALLLQTPYGWVDGNHFIGQTLKSVYILASQFWGEGAGAQDLIVSNNEFNSAKHADVFYALDMLQEAANFPNAQDEVIGIGVTAAPINQNIVVAGNSFLADRPVNLVNLSSVNKVVFDANKFLDGEGEDRGLGQRPVSVHDASNIYFSGTNRYDWLMESCADSQLLALADPAPIVEAIAPVACGVPATVSNFIFVEP